MKKARSKPKLSQTIGNELFVRANNQWEKGRLQSAFDLMLEASRAGDSGAQVNLGYFYDTGVGVKGNRKSALFWYRTAYRRGEMAAASNIATIYRDEGKFDRALSWFRRAAKLGDGDARLEIARLHLRRGATRPAIGELRRVIDARYVTEASKEEAQALLERLQT
jgi:uncharacterized protein